MRCAGRVPPRASPRRPCTVGGAMLTSTQEIQIKVLSCPSTRLITAAAHRPSSPPGGTRTAGNTPRCYGQGEGEGGWGDFEGEVAGGLRCSMLCCVRGRGQAGRAGSRRLILECARKAAVIALMYSRVCHRSVQAYLSISFSVTSGARRVCTEEIIACGVINVQH